MKHFVLRWCIPCSILSIAFAFAGAADEKKPIPGPKITINGKPLAPGEAVVIPGPDNKPFLVRMGSDGKSTMTPATPEDLKKYRVLGIPGVPGAPGVPDTTKSPPTPARKVEKPAQKFEDKASVDKRVKGALDWIARNQRPDGSWSTGMGDNRPAIVATTSYCALALMAADKKQYTLGVNRAVGYVMENIMQDRSVVKFAPNLDQSNWKVAIGGYFLCEYYAAQKKKYPKFKSLPMQKMIERLVADAFKRIEPSGGWGHTPRIKNPLDYIELEIMSNWMLTMLGAAKELGFKVPDEKLEKAITFIEECCNEGRGDVGYSPNTGQKGFGCPCRTGGAIFAFQLLGKQENKLYGLMVDSFKTNLIDSNEGHGSLAIGYLTSAMGARQLDTEVWQEFKDRFFTQILGAAEKNGTFGAIKGKSPKAQANCDAQVGSAYTTGIYALILQMDTGSLRFMNRKR